MTGGSQRDVHSALLFATTASKSPSEMHGGNQAQMGHSAHSEPMEWMLFSDLWLGRCRRSRLNPQDGFWFRSGPIKQERNAALA